MLDLFATADFYRPIAYLRATQGVAQRIKTLAQDGYGGVLATGFTADGLAEVENACARAGISWWLNCALPAESEALQAESFDVAADSAAGAWARRRGDDEWLAAWAVPVGEHGAVWAEAQDLLAPSAASALAEWGCAARFFTFSVGRQRRFWPHQRLVHELLHSIDGLTINLNSTAAWRGLWLQEEAGDACDARPAFPYAEGLESEFKAVGRRTFSAALPSLIADTGNTAVAERLAYWDAAFECAERDFWRPLRAACDANSWELIIGMGADKPASIEAQWGEMPRRYADRIALTQLGCDAVPHLSLRRADSYVSLDGGYAPIAEEDLDTDAGDLGVSRLIHDGSSPFSAASNKHYSRIAALANFGVSGAPTALLWPTRSLRSHYNPRSHRFIRWVEDDLERTARYLETLHFDYQLVPGPDLETARVEEGRVAALAISSDGNVASNEQTLLRCGRSGRGFEMVVLPSVTCLARAAWDKLEAFVEAGGKVVCLGLLPRWSERGRDEELEARIGRTTMLTVADLYSAYAGLESGISSGEISGVGYPVARSNQRGGRLSHYQPRLNEDAEDARLRVRQMLMDSLPPTLESQNDELLVQRREQGGSELYLLHNRSERPARINARLAAQAEAPSLWWSDGTDLFPVCEWMGINELEGGGLSVPLEMAGGETRALLVRNQGLNAQDSFHVERGNFVVERVSSTGAYGYALQSCIPAASWIEDGRIITRRAPPVTVPEPIMPVWQFTQDGWQANIEIPVGWQYHRIWFENPDGAPFRLWVGEQQIGTRVAPPWRLEIPSAVGSLQLRLECEHGPARSQFVAYPKVEITR